MNITISKKTIAQLPVCYCITYDNGYKVTIADHDVGPANVMLLQTGSKEALIAANREISEVAYYTFHHNP